MVGQWNALYLFVGQPGHIDELAIFAGRSLKLLTPACDDWFFIRYPEAGLHIRLRVGARAQHAYPEFKERLIGHCRALVNRDPFSQRVADFGYPDENGQSFSPGDYWEPAYEPEIIRYGGDTAIKNNEQLFRISAAVSLSIIKRNPGDRKARLSLAADLMLMTAAAMNEAIETSRFLSNYAAMWRMFWPSVTVNVNENVLKESAVSARLESFQNSLASGIVPTNVIGYWGSALIQAKSQFREIFEANKLVSPTTGLLLTTEKDYLAAICSMFTSQLHMLNNRLGFWPDTEIQISEWLLQALDSRKATSFAKGQQL